ncbi:MAG: hypothetical protein M3423_09165 [Actinomycetota bacterium]|nr:hypothetical protein [Actinomycetota bacterium]
MGARLRYAKVIDRELFFNQGGKLHPGLESVIVTDDEPGVAGAFIIFRGWADDHGSATEQWRIEGPDGSIVYQSVPREIHMPTKSHTERLRDEVSGLDLGTADGVYRVVFSLDDYEVARVDFPVELDGDPPDEPS